MNSTTTTIPCTRAYIEMMRGRRGDYRCHKCGWFGHLARHCRQREILAERRRKSEGGITLELKIPSRWRYKKTYGRIPTKWDTL